MVLGFWNADDADFNFGFGSAKAEVDDNGFYLRLKTNFCFKFHVQSLWFVVDF